MPAASWPRCCKACNPSAVSAPACGWPNMPKTPHSSCSLSSSKGCDSTSCIKGTSIGRRGLDLPLQLVLVVRRVVRIVVGRTGGRLGGVRILDDLVAGRRRARLLRFLAAQPLHDLRFRIVGQAVHQIAAEIIEPGLRFRRGDPFRLTIGGDKEVKKQNGDYNQDQAARRTEDEAERAI